MIGEVEMFDDKQKRLFNQGYGAYREIVSFCLENISLLEKEDEPSARAAFVVMCDLQLQRLNLIKHFVAVVIFRPYCRTTSSRTAKQYTR